VPLQIPGRHVFDLELNPNYARCLSIIGVAREVRRSPASG